MRRTLVVASVLVALLLMAAVTRVALSVFLVEAPASWVADGTDAHGDPLPEGAIARLGTIRFRTTTLTNLLWLDDGRIASGGFDEEIVIWDAATGERTQVLAGHRAPVVVPPRHWNWRDARDAVLRGEPPTRHDYLRWGHLAQTGDLLISAGATIREWDLATGAGRLVAYPRGGNVPVFALRDEGRVIEYPLGDVLRRLDLATGEELERRPYPVGEFVFELALSQDLRLRAAHSADGALGILDIASGESRRVAEPQDDVLPRAACFSHDGTTLWCVWNRRGTPEELETRHSRLTAIDVRSGRETARVELDDAAQWWVCASSPDGRFVVVSTLAGRVELRDARTLALRRVVDVAPVAVHGLSFAPDGERLALLVGGTSVSVVDVATGERSTIAGAHEAPVAAAVFLDDERVLTAGMDGVHRVWEARTGRVLWTRRGTRLELPADAPDGDAIAVAAENGLLIVRTDDGAVVSTRDVPPGWKARRAAPDGTLLLQSANAVALLEPGDDAPRVLVDRGVDAGVHDGVRTSYVAWDTTGNRLLIHDETRTRIDENSWRSTHALRLIDTRDLRTVWSRREASPDAVGLRGDLTVLGAGRRLLVLDGDGTVVHRMELPGDPVVAAVAFSPGGEFLATGDSDDLVRVWSLATGALRKTLRGHGGNVLALAWSPDGKLLVSTSTDTTALVWDVAE